MKGRVDISHHVPAKLFWFITIILLSLPVTTQYRLLIFGKYTNGIVVDHKQVNDLGIATLGSDVYPVIQFKTQNEEVFQMYGFENFEYPIGTQLRVVYNPDNPKSCIIFTFGNLYTSRRAIIPGILFLLWLAFYLAFKSKD